jgi:hypothetical protein
MNVNEVSSIEGSKTVALTTVPEALSSVDRWVEVFEVRANTANTVACRVGFTATDGQQKWELLPSEWKSWRAPKGKLYNLAKIFVDVGVNGEGVIFHAGR